MKRYCTIISICTLLFMGVPIGAQVNSSGQDQTEDAKREEKALNVNLDATLLYGQYNSINSDFSVTQDFKNFSYQLNSNFKRSNDYGFSNTSFFESQIGFTGMADLAESWKLIPQIEVENDSHGMYKNPFYSREEKDYVNLHFKNEYTPTPSRWTFNIGGAHYMHRLVPEGPGFVSGQGFYKADGQIGWEYGWSAAVRAKLNVKAGFYDYSTKADNDTYVTADLIGSFKMTEFLVISLGPDYGWNRDETHFVGGKGSISTVNMKYLTMELAYTYDLKPFEPEAIYKLQKFIYPVFSLPPSKQQKGECKVAVEWKNDSEGPVSVSNLKLKVSGSYEKLSDYYNLHLLQEYVVYPGVMALYCAKGKGEITMDIRVGDDNDIRLGAGYEYNHYRASRRVTYKPGYAASAMMKIRIQRLGIDWNNSLMGSVYMDPYSAKKLGRSLIGSVTLSLRILESFYLYGKVDNVYNERYHYRYGYPEPGRHYLGGLRIQI